MGAALFDYNFCMLMSPVLTCTAPQPRPKKAAKAKAKLSTASQPGQGKRIEQSHVLFKATAPPTSKTSKVHSAADCHPRFRYKGLKRCCVLQIISSVERYNKLCISTSNTPNRLPVLIPSGGAQAAHRATYLAKATGNVT